MRCRWVRLKVWFAEGWIEYVSCSSQVVGATKDRSRIEVLEFPFDAGEYGASVTRKELSLINSSGIVDDAVS